MEHKIIDRAVLAILDMTAMGLTVGDLKEMLPEIPLQALHHAANDLFQRWRVQRLVMRSADGKEFFVYFSVHLKTSCPVTPQVFDDRDDQEMKLRVQQFLEAIPAFKTSEGN